MTRVKRYILLKLMIIAFGLVFTEKEQRDEFFRHDYKYIGEMQSYYKIHTIPKTWNKAKRRCDMEGAYLWFPANELEADAVLTYLNETQYTTNMVYVGISSLFAKGVFKAIDGTAVRDIYNEWSVGEPNDADENEDCVVIQNDGYYKDEVCSKKLPFICKKTLSSLKWNNDCNVPYMDYIYNRNLERCYKLHLKPLNWRDAFEVCDAELSYLAIVNSEEEAKYLINMTRNAPKQKATGSLLQGQIHVGFSFDESENDWRTISGDSLEQAGYMVWGQNEPNGGGSERCGSMYDHGGLNDMHCKAYNCYFICERENEMLSYLNERFGSKFYYYSTLSAPKI